MIDTELDFEVFLCSIILGHESPRVVDQNMQWQVASMEVVCKVANGTACKQLSASTLS